MSEVRDNLVVRIESMLSKLSSSASYNPRIYKVPEQLRQVNEGAYNPLLIAIGPIHHNKDHLQDMEQLKVSYLYEFLQRTNQTVEKYVVKLRELEERARNCYSNFIQLPEMEKFVEMLLLDGFFVLQLLRKLACPSWWVKNDIIQSTQALKRILMDLLLVEILENQLPFFILSQLFDMTKSNHPDDHLSSLILRAFWSVLPWKQALIFQIDHNNVDDHLLGLLYATCFSRNATRRSNNEHFPHFEAINTASELHETGICFKMAQGISLVDVSFDSDGVMQLPHMIISDSTEMVLRNFIAYEQMMTNSTPIHQPVSDYIDLIAYLVNSSKDVEILRRAGIFRNMLGDDETVHLMFNKLGRHVIIHDDQFCYLEVFDRVNKHCNRPRNKWMAMLRRNYLNNPWACLSVIAAIILLLLTTTQTVFTILPYM